MGRHTLEGNPPIAVILRSSARAKRLSLRVSRLDGRVTLTLPPRTSTREGVAFLRSKEDWLRGHLEQMRPAVCVGMGAAVPFRGQDFIVVAGPRAAVAHDAQQFRVSAAKAAAPQVKAMLRQQAREVLAQSCDSYARLLGKTYTRLSMRDTRSRWGSCSSEGVLMFSWRLIMAPPEVLDYVAAHEVAHLVEMNHHQAFWDVVAGICPGYQAHRDWLRVNGDSLHRVRFDD